ncbi:ATP-binding cassette domain-containing protein [Kingella potus]|uniref:ATP-binding cassette domain-containing protein n=1 Tax=Kingella potus TaxID=265175 RepID=UPI001FD233CF|nr:ATP-binding cassette domain-containing protein [Kingella potus]UOP01126.1 ATP-binding cassette domain-containing protein [Kingella potus]
MIQIRNVSHSIGGQTILDDISLDLPEGGITALIGPNGAGKSTLLSFAARLQPLKHGSISVGGHDVTATPSVSWPKSSPSSHKTTASSAASACATCSCSYRYPYHQGRPSENDKAIVEDALDTFELRPYAGRYLTELSGGQRQRGMIAMVFCQQTGYVLLDEPLNNLDMYHARALMRLLRRLTDEHRRTTVVVLHDINQAAAYADHIVAMKKGRVFLSGPPEQVFTADNIQALFDMDTDVLDYKGKKLVVHHI